jgi:fructose-bisphosphate aldolase class II
MYPFWLQAPRCSPSSLLSQINVNSWCRDPYLERLYKGIQAEEPLPDVIEAATEMFAGECERFMRLFGSAGKA